MSGAFFCNVPGLECVYDQSLVSLVVFVLSVFLLQRCAPSPDQAFQNLSWSQQRQVSDFQYLARPSASKAMPSARDLIRPFWKWRPSAFSRRVKVRPRGERLKAQRHLHAIWCNKAGHSKLWPTAWDRNPKPWSGSLYIQSRSWFYTFRFASGRHALLKLILIHP